jgi:hypothetical protein
MAKKTAGLEAEQPNRKTKSDRVGGVPSRNNKASKDGGDVYGPLDPTGLGNKRTGRDFSDSSPAAKGKRPDALGFEDSTRKDAADPTSRAVVKRIPGIDAVRINDRTEQVAQGNVPNDLDIP